MISGFYWLANHGITAPVRVRVEVDATGVTAIQPETGIYGCAPSTPDAIWDLRSALREHRDCLEESADLAPDLHRQLRFLRAHLAPA